jgi:hypothetical protein
MKSIRSRTGREGKNNHNLYENSFVLLHRCQDEILARFRKSLALTFLAFVIYLLSGWNIVINNRRLRRMDFWWLRPTPRNECLRPTRSPKEIISRVRREQPNKSLETKQFKLKYDGGSGPDLREAAKGATRRGAYKFPCE